MCIRDRLGGSPGDAAPEALVDWTSIEHTARYLAVDRSIASDDGIAHFYCGGSECSNHNFYVYEEMFARRLWLVPWDLDNAFVVQGPLAQAGDLFLKVVNAWDELDIACEPVPGAVAWTPYQLPPSCDPIIGTMACSFHDAYDAARAQLLAGPFSESSVQEVLAQWRAQVADEVQAAYDDDAEQLSPDAWGLASLEFDARVQQLRELASP